MAERNNSDALNELMNGVDNEKGIADLLNDKLDKNGKVANAAHADRADTADTATTAGKATNDGNGNNIAQTYAKLSDIPSSVDAYSKTESDAKFLAISGKETINNIEYFKVNSNVSFAQLTDFATSGVIFLRDTEIRAIDGSNWGSFKFKSDGIYMNGTKITN